MTKGVRKIIVNTESGNTYVLWPVGTAYQYPTTLFQALLMRDHDVDLGQPASGAVLEHPVVRQPMRLAWVHPVRGPQVRTTTPVTSIAVDLSE